MTYVRLRVPYIIWTFISTISLGHYCQFELVENVSIEHGQLTIPSEQFHLQKMSVLNFENNNIYILRLVPFLSNSDNTLPGSLKRLLNIIAAII